MVYVVAVVVAVVAVAVVVVVVASVVVVGHAVRIKFCVSRESNRATSMAAMYSATRPLMLIRCPYGCIPDRRVPSRQLIPRDEWLSDGNNHHRH